jgi:uncharacterized protein YjbJ (UPF0337 family)
MRTTKVLVVFATAVGLTSPMAVSYAQSGTTGGTTTIEREANTAWAKIKGAWTQSKGAVKEQWGKLTDDDIAQINGRREVLVGKLQTRYAITHEEAERQVQGFETRQQ